MFLIHRKRKQSGEFFLSNSYAFLALSLSSFETGDGCSKCQRKRLASSPFNKQRNHYPAVKVGRLAVDKSYAHQGIGRLILDSVKYVFTHGNRTGCRFLTVDALADAMGFYERNGFRFFTQQDENHDTRLMYFDLKDFL